MELDGRELKRLKELVPYKVLAPTPDEICNEIEEKNKQLDKYKNAFDKIKEYIKENSIYYNTSDGCQWVDQFKLLDKIDKLLEEVK